MVNIGMHKCRRDNHRGKTLDDGRNAQIARNGILAKHPHLHDGLVVVHSICYTEIGAEIDTSRDEALEHEDVDQLLRGER